MKELNRHELHCLQKIADAPSDLLPPCAVDTLQHLESLGLIERAAVRWAPV
jgi:hypothetical protein